MMRSPQKLKRIRTGQMWWCMPIIPALRMLKQEDHKSTVSLGYIVRFLSSTPTPKKESGGEEHRILHEVSSV
jgi:hypothetical protein